MRPIKYFFIDLNIKNDMVFREIMDVEFYYDSNTTYVISNGQ